MNYPTYEFSFKNNKLIIEISRHAYGRSKQRGIKLALVVNEIKYCIKTILINLKNKDQFAIFDNDLFYSILCQLNKYHNHYIIDVITLLDDKEFYLIDKNYRIIEIVNGEINLYPKYVHWKYNDDIKFKNVLGIWENGIVKDINKDTTRVQVLDRFFGTEISVKHKNIEPLWRYKKKTP